MADIEAMYYQVHVRVHKKDRGFLRFYWWSEGYIQHDPIEYRMMVHPFGAISSPSCANMALQKAAEVQATSFSPDMVNTVLKNFYVDDCLKSVSSVSDAMSLAQHLGNLCKKGGF